MKLLLRYFTCFIFTFSCSALFAQVQTSSDIQIKKPHHDLVYVFGEDWIQNNPEIVDLLEECKQNRISFTQQALTASDKYPLLSSFPLMSKNNPNVVGADFSNFTPDGFNPFTYCIEFLSDKAQVIRIDGTDFIMIIAPVVR